MSAKSSIDPEYEVSDTIREQIKIREEIERNNLIDRVRSIIKKEFQNELELREKQLELIQQRLTKAAKTLHLLRYCLVTSYYNRPECILNEEEACGLLSQNRIHPAIKKLLGKNSLDAYKMNAKRNRTKLKYFNTKPAKPALKTEPNKQEVDTYSSGSADNTATNSENEMDLTNPVRNRNLTKHHIVVGNISKWMPSESEEDGSTHKWMVYVRGPKESPEINHIVQKVLFYLHPSYKPNDVIEVSESPFHLSRRGWGEFPVRVQLYFRCKLNKPVDIIHNLKLDRTYTGRQTLGNETIVELSLYKNEKTDAPNFDKKPNITSDIHLINLDKEMSEFNTTEGTSPQSIEHNYCSNGVENVDLRPESEAHQVTKLILNNISLDHTYCESLDSPNSKNQQQKSTTVDTELQRVVNDVSNVERISTADGRLIVIRRLKRPQQSLLIESVQKKQKLNLENHQVNLPPNQFRTTEQALMFLLKRLPIVTNLAADLSYQIKYPYATESLEHYASWNIGKKFASEWSRARTLKKILLHSEGFRNEVLSTKKILLFARSCGYTPLVNYEIFNKPVDINFKSVINSKISSNSNNNKWTLVDTDCHVNVVDSDDEQTTNSKHITIFDNNYKMECSYIKQSALDVGVLLKPEEIIPDVLFNCAERMLVEATKCFLEDLIRKSRSCLVLKGNFCEGNSIITSAEIRQALKERPEFDKILSFNNAVKNVMKY